MFDYISGKIAAVTENKVIVDCGGVGFSLTGSAVACAEYSRKAEAKIPVYLAVREDALELFGFLNERERELFIKLIGVSGVGAKLAIAILGGMSETRLISAIVNGDVAALSSIKGVGKKTAERIALELKGAFDGIVVSTDGLSATALDENAVLALVGLGYERKEAELSVKRVSKPDMTTEQLVFAVLHG